MKTALPCGILASFFFAFTFLLNRSMSLTGGYWMWSGCLRYLISLPILALVLILQNTLQKSPSSIAKTMHAIRKDPVAWVLWSTIGFGLFYTPMTLASTFGESWLTASTWQLTIVAGVLLTPLFSKKIPVRNILCSCIIIAGVVLLETQYLKSADGIINAGNLTAVGLILISAFAYPLGNRKMMQHCPDDLSTLERIFGMTICSAPYWILEALAAFMTKGAPSSSQLLQSFGVALFSSVIATMLFFHGTDLVKNDPRKLAVIEATQCGEVLFTLLLGVLVLKDAMPTMSGLLGIALIVTGMILNALCC